MQLIQDGNEYILALPSEAEHSLGWKLDSNPIRLNRLCERSAAIHTLVPRVDCRVAALLAKTNVQI